PRAGRGKPVSRAFLQEPAGVGAPHSALLLVPARSPDRADSPDGHVRSRPDCRFSDAEGSAIRGAEPRRARAGALPADCGHAEDRAAETGSRDLPASSGPRAAEAG